ncbi:MAG: 2-keto-3-deoxy-L-rhamnonate aldolase RhmA [Natrialbaceae archaeon]|jgi:2-keto-3-deoxy-L-rhamnonate aldolase RhmA
MTVRDAIRDREPVTATWVSIGHPAIAELSSALNFDLVFLDTEHAPTSVETLENMLRGVAAGGDAAPIVRVPWNDQVRIKRALDVGAQGVMAPMIDTREEAESFVAAARYPPDGNRGVAPVRASGYVTEFEEYVETANERILTIAQIETERGVKNAGGIAAVEDLDALFVGPADLSTALGHFGRPDHKEVDDAIESVVEAAHDEGTAVGTIATDLEDIPHWMDRGMDFLVVGLDVGYLADGASRALEAYDRALNR